MNRIFAAGAVICALVLGACEPDGMAVPAGASASGSQLNARKFNDLPAFFDCVREEGGTLPAAHRGGPVPGYPENALETLRHGLERGIHIMEVDVAESRDGVPFLMHDRNLGRTVTGRGAVADTDWEVMSRQKLIDNDGAITRFNPPRLSQVLLWARDNGVILELDKKDTASFRNIISLVRAAQADHNVTLITYSDEQALEVARLAPDLMIKASVNSREHQRELEQGGVDMTRVIAWTGTSQPNDRAWRALASRNIESAFGTLGRAGERLDDQYIADGDLSEYLALAQGGLTLLSTDRAHEVADFLTSDDRAMAACTQG